MYACIAVYVDVSAPYAFVHQLSHEYFSESAVFVCPGSLITKLKTSVKMHVRKCKCIPYNKDYMREIQRSNQLCPERKRRQMLYRTWQVRPFVSNTEERKRRKKKSKRISYCGFSVAASHCYYQLGRTCRGLVGLEQGPEDILATNPWLAVWLPCGELCVA